MEHKDINLSLKRAVRDPRVVKLQNCCVEHAEVTLPVMTMSHKQPDEAATERVSISSRSSAR